MPCYLFTYHAFGTWMADRDEGFVRRNEGIRPPDSMMAKMWREATSQTTVYFDDTVQKLLIDESLVAAEKQALRLHSIATESTHLHVLVSWRSEQPWRLKSKQLKRSLSIRLSREFGRRSWFVENSSRKRVRTQSHFDHLAATYLPDHRGWKWSESRGWFK